MRRSGSCCQEAVAVESLLGMLQIQRVLLRSSKDGNGRDRSCSAQSVGQSCKDSQGLRRIRWFAGADARPLASSFRWMEAVQRILRG